MADPGICAGRACERGIWVEALEGGNDEAAVAVYVVADGGDGDAAVGDVEGGEVGAGEDRWLDAGCVGECAEVEVPEDAVGVD